MKAFSVRQPWAWLIIHGPKCYENRAWPKRHPGRSFRGPVLIHAAQGMTQAEYQEAAITAHGYEIDLPPARELQRGGIIGQVEILDWHDQAPQMPFAFGSGFSLHPLNKQALPFQACAGALGFFTPHYAPGGPLPPPRWSLPKGQPAAAPASEPETPSLFATP